MAQPLSQTIQPGGSNPAKIKAPQVGAPELPAPANSDLTPEPVRFRAPAPQLSVTKPQSVTAPSVAEQMAAFGARPRGAPSAASAPSVAEQMAALGARPQEENTPSGLDRALAGAGQVLHESIAPQGQWFYQLPWQQKPLTDDEIDPWSAANVELMTAHLQEVEGLNPATAASRVADMRFHERAGLIDKLRGIDQPIPTKQLSEYGEAAPLEDPSILNRRLELLRLQEQARVDPHQRQIEASMNELGAYGPRPAKPDSASMPVSPRESIRAAKSRPQSWQDVFANNRVFMGKNDRMTIAESKQRLGYGLDAEHRGDTEADAQARARYASGVAGLTNEDLWLKLYNTPKRVPQGQPMWEADERLRMIETLRKRDLDTVLTEERRQERLSQDKTAMGHAANLVVNVRDMMGYAGRIAMGPASIVNEAVISTQERKAGDGFLDDETGNYMLSLEQQNGLQAAVQGTVDAAVSYTIEKHASKAVKPVARALGLNKLATVAGKTKIGAFAKKLVEGWKGRIPQNKAVNNAVKAAGVDSWWEEIFLEEYGQAIYEGFDEARRLDADGNPQGLLKAEKEALKSAVLATPEMMATFTTFGLLKAGSAKLANRNANQAAKQAWLESRRVPQKRQIEILKMDNPKELAKALVGIEKERLEQSVDRVVPGLAEELQLPEVEVRAALMTFDPLERKQNLKELMEFGVLDAEAVDGSAPKFQTLQVDVSDQGPINIDLQRQALELIEHEQPLNKESDVSEQKNLTTERTEAANGAVDAFENSVSSVVDKVDPKTESIQIGLEQPGEKQDIAGEAKKSEVLNEQTTEQREGSGNTEGGESQPEGGGLDASPKQKKARSPRQIELSKELARKQSSSDPVRSEIRKHYKIRTPFADDPLYTELYGRTKKEPGVIPRRFFRKDAGQAWDQVLHEIANDHPGLFSNADDPTLEDLAHIFAEPIPRVGQVEKESTGEIKDLVYREFEASLRAGELPPMEVIDEFRDVYDAALKATGIDESALTPEPEIEEYDIEALADHVAAFEEMEAALLGSVANKQGTEPKDSTEKQADVVSLQSKAASKPDTLGAEFKDGDILNVTERIPALPYVQKGRYRVEMSRPSEVRLVNMNTGAASIERTRMIRRYASYEVEQDKPAEVAATWDELRVMKRSGLRKLAKERSLPANGKNDEIRGRLAISLGFENEWMALQLKVAAKQTNARPTEAQAEAENYKVGRLRYRGQTISIENPKGSIRRGTAPDGTKWQQKMANTYGRILGTTNADGDHTDVFFNDNAPVSENVYIVNQMNKDGSFDEEKVLLGFESEQAAREAYLANYKEGWDGFGSMDTMSWDAFNDLINDATEYYRHIQAKKTTKGVGGQDGSSTAADLGIGRGTREAGLPVGQSTTQPDGNRARRNGNGVPGADGQKQSDRSASATGIPTGDPAIRGESGNQPSGTQTPEPRATTGIAGGADAPRSRGTGDAGILSDTRAIGNPERNTAESEPDGSSNEGAADASRAVAATLASRIAAQQAAETTPVVLNDAGNIRDTLPILFPEQHDDVIHAENRLLVENQPGMLYTNGTGTGKTFTGLGIIKRFLKLGKSEILILTPKADKNRDWLNDAKLLGIDARVLSTTTDGGQGVTITTYANFYQNRALAQRDFDLVVYDESHRLDASKGGTSTVFSLQHKAITKHPKFLWHLAQQRSPKWQAFNQRMEALAKQVEQQYLGQSVASPDALLETAYNAVFADLATLFDAPKKERIERVKNALLGTLATSEASPLASLLEEARAEIRTLSEQLKSAPRSKVVFLSASPFAYHVSLDYAEGYLFDYDQEDGAGYNVASGRDKLLQDNFGYQMKNGRLEQPDANVNVDLMERLYFEKLKKSGAVRGRQLKVPVDYSRHFVDLSVTRQGALLNNAFATLYGGFDNGFDQLRSHVSSIYTFQYLNYMMESMKAAEAVNRTHQHIELGRKVVLFHGYKKPTKDFSNNPLPFRFAKKDTTAGNWREREDAKAFNAQVERFYAAVPGIETVRWKFPDPLGLFKKEFGAAAVFVNGDVPARQRSKNVDAFNRPDGPKVIVMQIDAGKEGTSLHDTSGDMPRAVINIGLPYKPMDLIQSEGRIYRLGSESNAVYEYLKLGLNFEQVAFNQKISTRSRTAENLALGQLARDMEQVLKDGYLNSAPDAPSAEQGTGGKQNDARLDAGELSGFDYAKSFYFAKQKRTNKTKSKEGADYFATPEPVGFKMVEWAGIKPGDRVLEPSAGDGAIGRWFPENTNNTFVEPSYELMTQLQTNVGGSHNRFEGEQFEDLYIGNKYHAVIMNPPFGAGGKTAIEHLAKAFVHLKNGGRLVALIPEGSSANKRFDKWYESDVAKEAYIAGTIQLPNLTFARAGTQVKTRVVIIDKQGDPADAHQSRELSFDHVSDINELFDRLEDVSFDSPNAPTTVETEEEMAERERQEKFDRLRGLPKMSMVGGVEEELNRFSVAPDELGFYSAVEQAVEGLRQESFTPAQLLGQLRKMPGIKREELDDLGLEEYLTTKGTKVSKNEVLEFVRAGGVRLEEVVKGDLEYYAAKSRLELAGYIVHQDGTIFDRDNNELYPWELALEGLEDDAAKVRSFGNRGLNTQKYSEYQLPGGENYREVLLTVPSIGERVVSPNPAQPAWAAYRAEMEAKYGSDIGYNDPRMSAQEQKEYDRLVEALDSGESSKRVTDTRYKSDHWNEDNVVAHLRLNDRTGSNGEKILFIEEIQSDWHQEGRGRGYQQNPTRAVRNAVRSADIVALKGQAAPSWYDVFDAAGNEMGIFYATSEEMALDAARGEGNGVPDAPHKKSWAMLAFKRALKLAVDGGYDSVAWTPGAVQAERYDLSKQVDAVRWHENDDSTFNIGFSKDDDWHTGKNGAAAEELPGIVGKELAQKIVAAAQNEVSGTFTGLELKVGGEGMRGFYDQILPKEVGKYVRKMGGKVGKVELSGALESSGWQLYDDYGHSIDWFEDKESLLKSADEGSVEVGETEISFTIDGVSFRATATKADGSQIIKETEPVEVWNLPITEKMRGNIVQGQPRYSLPRKKRAQTSLPLAEQTNKDTDYGQTTNLQRRDRAGDLVRDPGRSTIQPGVRADIERRVGAERSRAIRGAQGARRAGTPERLVAALQSLAADYDQVARDGGLQRTGTGQTVVPIRSDVLNGFVSGDGKTIFVSTTATDAEMDYARAVEHETFHTLENAGGELGTTANELVAAVHKNSPAFQQYHARLSALAGTAYADALTAHEIAADFFAGLDSHYGVTLADAFGNHLARAKHARGWLQTALRKANRGKKRFKGFAGVAKFSTSDSMDRDGATGRKTNSSAEEIAARDAEYLKAVEREEWNKAQRIINRLWLKTTSIPKPLATPDDISTIAQSIDYYPTEDHKDWLLNDVVPELKRKGIFDLDAYHVTDAKQDSIKNEGLAGSELSSAGGYENARESSVYLFLDPDDIVAGYSGILSALEDQHNVVHLKIPVEHITEMIWDGNFNVTYGAYSAVQKLGDIPAEWIVGFYTMPTLATTKEDASGNIIPLSERFNLLPGSDAGQKESAPEGALLAGTTPIAKFQSTSPEGRHGEDTTSGGDVNPDIMYSVADNPKQRHVGVLIEAFTAAKKAETKTDFRLPSKKLLARRERELVAALESDEASDKATALARYAVRTMPDSMRWRLKGTLQRLANDPAVDEAEFFRAAINKAESLLGEIGVLASDPQAKVKGKTNKAKGSTIESPKLTAMSDQLKTLADQRAQESRPVTDKLTKEFTNPNLADPVLKSYSDTLNKSIRRRQEKQAAKTVGENKKAKLGQLADVERSFGSLQERTGIPFWHLYRRIFILDRDVDFDSKLDIEGVFDGLKNNKGKPAKVEDMIYNKESEQRILHLLNTGKTPPRLTDFESTVAERIRLLYKQWEPFVKRHGHKQWMRSNGKQKPNNATHAQMRAGEKIVSQFGEESQEYADWIDSQDFGVRRFYTPQQHVDGDAAPIRGSQKRNFARGFLKERKDEAEYKSLIGGLYSYIRNARRLRDLEPQLKLLEQLFLENHKTVDSGLLDRFLNNLYGDRINLDFTQRALLKGTGKFFAVRITQAAIRWVLRNKFQPVANVVPRTADPLNPRWWKHVLGMLTPKGGKRVGTVQRFINRKIKAGDPFAIYFHRYISSLDAARTEKFMLEMDQYTHLASLKNGFMRLYDKIGRAYTWSDVDNRAQVFVYAYEAGKEALERYRKKPTPRNLNRFLRWTGAESAPKLEQNELMGLIDQGKDMEAVYMTAHRLADATQFRYARSEKGLAWQEPGKGAHVIAPIATYSKGTLQMLGDELAAINDFMRAPGRISARRARRALEKLALWYLVSLLLNRLYEEIYGVDRGAYGLNTLKYTPGGPVLENAIKAIDAIYAASSMNKGWDYKAARITHEVADFYVPLYHLINRLATPTKKTAEGTHLVQPYFKLPLEFRRLVKEKIAKITGSESPRDTRRWVELKSGEQIQRILLDGAHPTSRDKLLDLYGKWMEAEEFSKKEKAAGELMSAFRKYPLSTQRSFRGEQPRSRDIRSIRRDVPSVHQEWQEDSREKWRKEQGR